MENGEEKADETGGRQRIEQEFDTIICLYYLLIIIPLSHLSPNTYRSAIIVGGPTHLSNIISAFAVVV